MQREILFRDIVINRTIISRSKGKKLFFEQMFASLIIYMLETIYTQKRAKQLGWHVIWIARCLHTLRIVNVWFCKRC